MTKATKIATRHVFRVLLGTTMLTSAAAAHAQTLPTGGNVAAGSATITATSNATTISQTSDRAVINWSGFSVGQGDSVIFAQPSAQSATLNRVTGNTASTIAGQITSNGAVYLVNPNGIAITASGTVNTAGGLVASTLDMADEDFMGGRLSFTGPGASKAVSNAGSIRTGQGAYVALLGGAVSNSGTIRVPMGRLALGSGEQVALDINGGNFLQVAVPTSLVTGSSPLIENSGEIVVMGGMVELKAAVLRDAVRNVVNMSGSINADSAVRDGGTIHLIGGSDSANMAGKVTVSGSLSARATGASGNGGFIETSGAHLDLAGAQVTTLAAHGQAGTWLIDPVDFTVAASGGDMTGAQLTTNLAGGNVTILSSSGANGTSGDITINDAVSWSANTLTLDAYRNITINAVMSASGTAGFAGIVGDQSQNGTGSGSGALNFGLGGGGFYGRLDLGANSSFRLNGTAYTVITSLGSEGSNTGTHLQGINGALSGNYVLGADIDASPTATWNSGSGFVPLGTDGAGNVLNSWDGFTGRFSGLGHTISNLTINRPAVSNVGLFGFAGSGSTIGAIGLVGGSVSGTDHVGGLVGYAPGSTISEAYATGAVSGTNLVGGLVGWANGSTISEAYATGAVNAKGDYAGGLVGYAWNNSISEAYATGAVNTKGDYAGGLVGDADDSTISEAYATGAVSGTNYAGGLVGLAWSSTISEAYVTGAVSGTHYVGGLAGYADGSTMSEAYATGAVSGTGSVGGLVGYAYRSTISNAYATGAVRGQADVGGLVGTAWGNTISNAYWDSYSTGQTAAIGFHSVTTITALNFVTSDPGQSAAANYAFKASAYTNLGSGFVAMDGVRPMGAWEAAPVQGDIAYITNAHQLQLINASSSTLSGNYGLAYDIDLSETGIVATCLAASNCTPGSYAGMWAGSGFVPLGTDGAGTPLNGGVGFTGSFSGLGHAISGLTINRPTASFVGLFGVAGSGSTIGAIGLVGGSVSGSDKVGGLVGWANGSTISEAYATGAVSGTNLVGGLVGYADSSTISEAYATGAVSGTDYVGGLVGLAFGNTISEAYATGAVSGTGPVGGLVGYAYGSTISEAYWDSYSTGQTAAIGGDGGSNTITAVNFVTSDPGQSAAANYAFKASAWSNFTANGSSDVDATGGQALTWRIYEGLTYPLLKAFLTPATVTFSSPNARYDYDAHSHSLAGTYTLAAGVNQNLILGTVSPTNRTNVGSSPLDTSGLYSTQQGYDLVTTGGGTLTIDPVALSITGDNGSHPYTSNVQTNTYRVTGLLGTDSVTGVQGLGSGTYASTYADNLSDATGSGLSNYTISYTNGALTITPVALSITGDTGSHPYTGNVQTNTYRVTGLLGTDSVTGVQGLGYGTNASTYADTLSNARGMGLSNYTISYTNGALTITPLALTLTYTANAVSILYGLPLPGFSGTVSANGLVGSDTLANFGTRNWATVANSSSLAGHYAINGSGLANSNYTITVVQAPGNATALTIMPLEQSLSSVLPYANTNMTGAGLKNDQPILEDRTSEEG